MARITKAMVNEWWNNTPFWLMENITGYRQDDFSPEDGYQDFVDACDTWWDNLSFNEFRINFEEILHMYMMNKILNANHNQCNEKAIKNCLYKLV